MVTSCTAAYRRSRETPIPELSTRFRALKHRNFQLFIIGQLISLVGTWMQTTAQQWLVYKLTGSVAVLGVVGLASQVPRLLLAWMGGDAGERYKRPPGVSGTRLRSWWASSTRLTCPSANPSACTWWGRKTCRMRSRLTRRFLTERVWSARPLPVLPSFCLAKAGASF